MPKCQGGVVVSNFRITFACLQPLPPHSSSFFNKFKLQLKMLLSLSGKFCSQETPSHLWRHLVLRTLLCLSKQALWPSNIMQFCSNVINLQRIFRKGQRNPSQGGHCSNRGKCTGFGSQDPPGPCSDMTTMWLPIWARASTSVKWGRPGWPHISPHLGSLRLQKLLLAEHSGAWVRLTSRLCFLGLPPSPGPLAQRAAGTRGLHRVSAWFSWGAGVGRQGARRPNTRPHLCPGWGRSGLSRPWGRYLGSGFFCDLFQSLSFDYPITPQQWRPMETISSISHWGPWGTEAKRGRRVPCVRAAKNICCSDT